MKNIECNLENYWTAKEIAEDENLIMDLENGNIRHCSRCGIYTTVDEFASEREINGVIFYDTCDDCCDKLLKKIDIITLEEYDYTDFIDDDYDDECDEEDC